MKILKYILIAIALVLTQIIVMNGVALSLSIYPCIYLYLLFCIPLRTNPVLLFSLSFGLGFAVDVFSDSLGINSMSMLVATLFYYLYLNRLESDKKERFSDFAISPKIKTIGWYLGLVFLTLLVHHFVFYLISDWSFKSFFEVFVLVFLSTFFVFILTIIFDILFFKDKF